MLESNKKRMSKLGKLRYVYICYSTFPFFFLLESLLHIKNKIETQYYICYSTFPFFFLLESLFHIKNKIETQHYIIDSFVDNDTNWIFAIAKLSSYHKYPRALIYILFLDSPIKFFLSFLLNKLIVHSLITHKAFFVLINIKISQYECTFL